MTANSPALERDEVHIWTALVPPAPPPDLAGTLSVEEFDRARRFRFAADRLRYVFAHAVLREVLSSYAGCPAADLRFARNRFGKPFLEATGGSRPPAFNLSHAGEVILLGVCGGGNLGIDVEQIRPVDDALSIAESQYGPLEYASVLAQPAGARDRAFFRCWTRKEAWVKALGAGLSIPLNSFDTLADAPALQVNDLPVPDGYVAAVAVEKAFDRLVRFEWT